ncbi:MAG: hypothetical protein SLRJCFUN_000257 [Candidatus Fervidibacter sp.]
MTPEIFILTTEPPERPGGMERFVSTFMAIAQKNGHAVRVFHRENCAPPRWRNPRPYSKVAWFLAGLLQGYYIGKAARQALRSGVRLVLSNSTVGWFPLGNAVKQAHFYHGTYRGQAEAIRPFISYKGYLKLKWWDAMVLERLSGRGKVVLCCSELVQEELRRFFGYNAYVMWHPLDISHFRPLDQQKCREQIGLKETAPVGLFVGSTHPMKGFPMVEHLMETYPEVQWVLALRGNIPQRVQSIPRAKVFQNAGYDLLPVLYNAADFSLVPSLYDPFAYVVPEALACGTPVIASPHVGASWTYHKGSVLEPLLTCSSDDKEGFQKAVEAVVSDPMKWRRIVLEQVRPRLIEMMAPENWWRRFCTVVGLTRVRQSER